jgi:alkanesulfonate monooxygenase SsuD/methylene tetrahydromethanopterin reductase-like flavin-dependent oxidoreductase (luciferase family)
MTFGLSILDQSTIASGRGADAAIQETLALARLADDWGYGRYWLALHSNTPKQSHSLKTINNSAIKHFSNGACN